MVEGQALIEWSPEIGLSLSQRFCSWVVPEMDAEDMEESLLEILPRLTKSQMTHQTAANDLDIQVLEED